MPEIPATTPPTEKQPEVKPSKQVPPHAASEYSSPHEAAGYFRKEWHNVTKAPFFFIMCLIGGGLVTYGFFAFFYIPGLKEQVSYLTIQRDGLQKRVDEAGLSPTPSFTALKFQAKVVAKHMTDLADKYTQANQKTSQAGGLLYVDAINMLSQEVQPVEAKLYDAGQDTSKIDTLVRPFNNGQIGDVANMLREVAGEITRLSGQLK